MKKIKRIFIYFLGMVLLASGLTLNTMTGLGASAIISVANVPAIHFKASIGNMTLLIYTIMVIAQLFLSKENKLKIIAEIPVSIIFTRFMNIFKNFIIYQNGNILFDFCLLLIAICLTGIGSSLIVNMRFIANPGDGFVDCLAKKFNKDFGTMKNITDFSCVTLSLILGYCFGNIFMGVGIGTFASMVLVGRVIHLFDKLFKDELLKIADIK